MQQLLTCKTRLAGFTGEWREHKLGNYLIERKETGYDTLELLSVGRNGVYPQDSEKKDTSNSNKSKYKRICIGDIGYNTMRMWQGRSALSSIEGIVSPAYTILRPKANADSIFFSYLFKLDEMIHKFYRNSQGMVSDTWMCKFKDLSIVKFQAPPTKEEQIAISNILKNTDQEIDKQKEYLDHLENQKKGLMQQLLTGKIRVN
jgi:type I restriction enzyme S subunit